MARPKTNSLEDACYKLLEVQQERIEPQSSSYKYGTAGFRGPADQILPIVSRVGMFAGFRALQMRAHVGVMITASHNPKQDNGVKLIDANGEMLAVEWEGVLESICNTHDGEQLFAKVSKLFEDHLIDSSKSNGGCVQIGYDTRDSSELFAKQIKFGIDIIFGATITTIDHGRVATPALHFLVGETNKQQGTNYQLPSVDTYYLTMQRILDLFWRAKESNGSSSFKSDDLVIDLANGVGIYTMMWFKRNFESRFSALQLINNDPNSDKLNESCGADYLKTFKKAPTHADNELKRYASVDGDADRVVYFYLRRDHEGHSIVRLLDGDKIMALYAHYFKQILKHFALDGQLTIGGVQTAYANGASTQYMTDVLGICPDFVDTGVKNLHKKAKTYDIGLYFEANGHGALLVSDKARALISALDDDQQDVRALEEIVAANNQYTGDAICNIFIVETILKHFDWSVTEWDAIYEDRPNCLIARRVKDKDAFATTDAGRTCVEPKGLQETINENVARFGPGARCFVRASGTENVIRIYSEAKSDIEANRLANLIGDEAELCG